MFETKFTSGILNTDLFNITFLWATVREHVKKNAFLEKASTKWGDPSPPPPPADKNESFFLRIKKCLEYSETNEYAKIFCQGYPVKKLFQNIFLKYWNFSNYFSFRTKVFFTLSYISSFSCFKNVYTNTIYTC